ncbi:YggT family protein [bacterium]|nr:YggT family protein [bacterium]
MFHLFSSLAFLVNAILTLLYWILIIRILLSWVNPDPYNPIVQAIYQITEPILTLFRRLPLRVGMVDLSPIIAFLVILTLQRFLVSILTDVAWRFQ